MTSSCTKPCGAMHPLGRLARGPRLHSIPHIPKVEELLRLGTLKIPRSAMAIGIALTSAALGIAARDSHAARLQQTTEQCASLVRLLALPNAELLVNTTQLQTRAFDTDDDCVTALTAHLTDTSSTRVGAAAYALSVIGTKKATDAIHAAVVGTAGDRARASLPETARGSAGESVLAAHYFAAAMSGPTLGPGWIPRHNAALTLGMMRARESSHALQTAADPTGRGGFISQAASAALLWMERTPCTMRDASKRDTGTSLSMAVLQCGVPTFQENTAAFLEQKFDGTPIRVWTVSDRGWAFRDALPGDNRIYPRLQFRTAITEDGMRATANVHTSDGPGNLTVYRYLLKKTGNVWRVTAIAFGGVG